MKQYMQGNAYFHPHKKYRFVMVSFSDYSKSYAYLCPDESIQEGDYVYVPVGEKNHQQVAEVVKVIYALPQDAPYDITKIKTVMGSVNYSIPVHETIKAGLDKGFLPTNFNYKNANTFKDKVEQEYYEVYGKVHHLTSHEFVEYHMKRSHVLLLKRALKWIHKERFADGYAILMQLLKKRTSLAVYSSVMTLYFDPAFTTILQSDAMAQFVHKRLLCKSSHREAVEFGLLMTVFLPFSEELLADMNVIMLCEDFTRYGVLGMKRFPDGNRHLFQLAKELVGEGRIHLIEAMDGTDPEIRDWFLYEGPYNFVGDGHGAKDCFEKCGLIDRLKAQPEGRELHAIFYLLRLTVGGVAKVELQEMEDLEESLRLYFERLDTVELGIEEYLACRDMYKLGEGQFPIYYKKARGHLDSPLCRTTVLRSLWHKDAKRMLEFLNDY